MGVIKTCIMFAYVWIVGGIMMGMIHDGSGHGPTWWCWLLFIALPFIYGMVKNFIATRDIESISPAEAFFNSESSLEFRAWFSGHFFGSIIMAIAWAATCAASAK